MKYRRNGRVDVPAAKKADVGDAGMSVKTVSTHRLHILEKMKMKTNAELTNYTIKQGLVCITDRDKSRSRSYVRRIH